MSSDDRIALVTRACRIIEGAEVPPTLGDLASEVGLSPHHLHRVFKAVIGVTPKAYAVATRAARARDGLDGGATVTDAIYGAGFASSGRFYEGAPGRLGMTPTQYRAGGSDSIVRFAVGECSLGAVLVAATDRGVCAIELGDDPDGLVRALQDRFHAAELVGGNDEFEALVARAVAIVEHPERPGLATDLPLDVRGTAFQERVWQALRAIPAGETRTYADIARAIGAPSSVRAVAGACGANHVAVAIPCHRVVRSDGSLSGYRWGVERKASLLAREAAVLD
jgi:AraC family transcriptional regulator of adaptative response/methylated-DNA-[protein]-cysteine methyltransferase